MYERSSTAFRGAVLLTILATACNDSPLAPRDRLSRSAPSAGSQAGIQVFAGRQADSVVHAFDAIWARSNHPDYRQARLAWHRANGIPDSIGAPAFTPQPLPPNVDLLSGDDGSWKPLPQIFSHYEAFHFGQRDQYTSVPDGIEAEVTFIGDQADISVSSITVTKRDGTSNQASGEVAQGAGVLINCADVLYGNCDNRRRLNGVMTVSAAATCDASASGAVSYSVSNVSTPLSAYSTSSSGGNTASASAIAAISGTASPCTTGDGGPETTDSTRTAPTGPAGVPSAPPPSPTGPYAPSYPPTSGGTTTSTYFHCEQGDIYQNGSLFETKITCYPS